MDYKYTKQIVVGYDRKGKQIRKRIYANTKSGLDRQQWEMEMEYQAKPDCITFGEYSKNWLRNKNVEPATKEAYRICLAHCLELDDLPLNDIRKSDIQCLISENWECAASCRKIRAVLVQIFDCAVDDELITKNPAKNLDMPKLNTPTRGVLSDEQLKALSECDLTDEERLFVDVLYCFGLRPGEALALTAASFNFAAGEVTIDKAIGYDKNGKGHMKGTKTGSVRVLPIPNVITEDRVKEDGLLFSGKNGMPISKATEKRMWRRIKQKWNLALGGDNGDDRLKGVKPYYFRYTFATDLYYSGISLKEAAYLMGHADTSMLLKIYAQLDEQREDLSVLRDRRY